MLNKIGVLRNCGKHTGKDLCWSLFLMKLHAPSVQLYQKRDSNTGILLQLQMKEKWSFPFVINISKWVSYILPFKKKDTLSNAKN